jgi:hypothetical protein
MTNERKRPRSFRSGLIIKHSLPDSVENASSSNLIMPKDQKEKHNSRQRPVSCKFCRVRKLRCSRGSPCSNCISRGITCELDQAIPQPVSDANSSESEIVARLRRLEELLVQQSSGSGILLGQNNEPVPEQAKDCQTPLHTSELGEQIQNLTKDVCWLENVFVTDGFDVRIE